MMYQVCVKYGLCYGTRVHDGLLVYYWLCSTCVAMAYARCCIPLVYV